MDQTIASTELPDSIIAPLTYSVDTGEKPVNETMEKGNLDRKYTGVFETHDMSAIPALAAKDLAEGKALGWFQGRMEFGPRALGARSILGDPRSPDTQRTLNLKVKFRESFRPFAPSVLAEHASAWFDFEGASPYMLLTAPVHADKRVSYDEEAAKRARGLAKLGIVRSEVPAITHVDGSARLQTVSKEDNLLYWELIEAFRRETGVPLVVNTSFNVRGEPIVCTPEDAFSCFMRTDLDVLYVENLRLEKTAQTVTREDFHREFAPD